MILNRRGYVDSDVDSDVRMGHDETDNFPTLPIAVDPTDDICAGLMQPFDPIPTQADQLRALVHTALPQKLPVIEYFFKKISNEVCGFKVVYLFSLNVLPVSIPVPHSFFSLL